MSKPSVRVQISVFILFIGLFFILNILYPDKTFSERENRTLQQVPQFNITDIISGKYTTDIEKYYADQFVFRDSWVTAKARCEIALGKKDNNDVYYCIDETLIKRFPDTDMSQIYTKIDSINQFAKNIDKPVYFGLIPGASDIWNYKLPLNAPCASQKSIIDYCYTKLININSIDVYSLLYNHFDEYIYYRTDHHWTSLGAYYGYMAIINAMLQKDDSLTTYNRNIISDSFYGTNYSVSGYSWVKPDSIETFVDGKTTTVESYINGLDSEPKLGGLYDYEYVDKKDKYSFFLGGVSPLVHVKSDTEGQQSLLIIRDSYSDELVPFLSQQFSDIYLIDLRYFKYDISEFISKSNIDKVLILYSLSNFCSDNNIGLLGI